MVGPTLYLLGPIVTAPGYPPESFDRLMPSLIGDFDLRMLACLRPVLSCENYPNILGFCSKPSSVA